MPPKTTSWRSWCQRLAAHAEAPETRAELGFWQASADQPGAVLEPDRDGSAAFVRETLTLSLDAQRTRDLLQTVPPVYNTRINDVLLCALTRAIAGVTGVDSVRIALEGHGREDLFDDCDIARTIGWFT